VLPLPLVLLMSALAPLALLLPPVVLLKSASTVVKFYKIKLTAKA
jgi:hypothetical protein